MRQWGRLGAGGTFAVVFALYVLGATVSWWMIRASDLGAVFFPPAGVTLVALLSLPRARWPIVIAAIIAGEFTAAFTVGDADDVIVVAGHGIANVAEPVVAALVISFLLRRTSEHRPIRPDLGDLREASIVGLGAVCIGPAVGAAIGSAVCWWRLDDLDVGEFAPQWWLGHALGTVLVAPLCLAWTSSRGARPWDGRLALVLVAVVAMTTAVVFTATDLPLLFIVLIGLVVLGAVFDVRTVAVSGAAIALVAGLSLAIDPDGLIGGLEPTTALWLTKVELLFFLLVAYAVAAEANARVSASLHSLHQAATVSELQRLLLPPSSLAGPGFRAVGVYEAAQREVGVGGDWYLVRRLNDGRIIIGVGDIVGHDIDAARTMAAVRSGLLLEAAIDPTPHRLLERLDSFASVEPSIMFGSAWLAWFDPTTRTLTYSRAGHLPPLLVHEDHAQRLDESNTALIGVAQGDRWSATVEVPPGARLVLYTDGLVERRSFPLDTGIDRLEAAVLGNELDPRSVVDHLLGDSLREDDSILVMIEFGEVDVRADPRTNGHVARAVDAEQAPTPSAGN